MVTFYETPFGHSEVRVDRRPQRPAVYGLGMILAPEKDPLRVPGPAERRLR
jgi:hypothetical protein